jgi:hypothetical protein
MVDEVAKKKFFGGACPSLEVGRRKRTAKTTTIILLLLLLLIADAFFVGLEIRRCLKLKQTNSKRNNNNNNNMRKRRKRGGLATRKM